MSVWRLCKYGDLDRLEEALRSGEDVNWVTDGGNPSGLTGLMYAAHKNRFSTQDSRYHENHMSILELLLRQPNIDINALDGHGNTALHYCVIGANIEGMRLLLAHPEMRSLNIKNKDVHTPLMRAVCDGRVGLVEVLLGVEGIDLDTRDGWNRDLAGMARCQIK